jgi:D-ribulokinase
MDCYHLGVDVGTGSARVGVFSHTGQLLESRSKEIKFNNPFPGFYEQSSADIWEAVKEIVKV